MDPLTEGAGQARQQRQAESSQLSRRLAGQLAEAADETARILEELAEFHQAVADVEGHPLHRDAADHAAEERRMAATERAASERFRRIEEGAVADGDPPPALSL